MNWQVQLVYKSDRAIAGTFRTEGDEVHDLWLEDDLDDSEEVIRHAIKFAYKEGGGDYETMANPIRMQPDGEEWMLALVPEFMKHRWINPEDIQA